MPWTKDDGSPGLLARGELGNHSKSIPELDVATVRDPRLLTALFRDYTFWASAYLLEPCHLHLHATGEYGLGRDRLLRNIAVPLATVAERLGMKPFMEYATSYALYNWRRRDQSRPLSFGNLALIRKFTGMPSEAGFILVHVLMVAHTPRLVQATLRVLRACREDNQRALNGALWRFLKAMTRINGVMETMWSRSDPDDYKEFRTFIMGIKGQPMFPHGVLYEGVSAEPVAYRGESGANDSIIPTADNLFQLYERMPTNPLTEILHDFRTYRPMPHTRWLEYVQRGAQQVGVWERCLREPRSALLMLGCLDQVRDFRQRHWNFVKEYILRHSTHPVATGGSPIVAWLPNQLETVIRMMQTAGETVKARRTDLSPADAQELERILGRIASQESVLQREVRHWQQRIPPPAGGGQK